MSESKTQVAGTLLAAVVTGIFTVVAGLATYWFTTKEPALTYSVSSGPAIAGPTGTKRIYVIEVRNTGRKEVTQTLAEIRLSGSQFEEIATEISPGVKLSEQRKPETYTATADFLNPDEFFKVSLLLSGQTSGAEPTVAVRALGVPATLLSPATPKRLGIKDLPVLAAAVIGAVASVLLTLNPFLRRFLRRPAVAAAIPGSPLERNEVLAYICARCALEVESRELRFSNSELSYRGASDYLLLRAAKLPQRDRRPYTAALKCMLLIEAMSPRSKQTIRRAIQLLSPERFDGSELDTITKAAIDEGDEPNKLRDEVDRLVESELHGSSASEG